MQKKPENCKKQKKNDGLTPRISRFCFEYVIDNNATQAAIRAGYSDKTAAAQACRLLINVNVKKEIARLQAETVERLKKSADDVLLELWWAVETAKTNVMEERILLKKGGESQALKVYNFRAMRDFLAACEQLARHYGVDMGGHFPGSGETTPYSEEKVMGLLAQFGSRAKAGA